MSILTCDQRRFSDEEVGVARSFAGQAAISLTNSRLYEDAGRRAQRLAELNRLGALVASSLDRAEIFRRIVHAGQGLLGAGLVRLWLLDKRGEKLELTAGAGPSDSLPGALRTIPVKESLYGKVLRERAPFRSRNVFAEPLFRNRAFAEREGLRSCLVVPLLHESKALGVLSVLANGERNFPDEDVELLQALAGYAALALENAQLADEVGRLEGQRELDRLKGEFLSTVSHELRTPLSYIHGYAELLSMRDLPSAQVKEMASEIHRGSTTMIRMVDDLLDFSRLETAQLTMRIQPTDLGELLGSTATTLIGQSGRHSLRLDIASNLPRVAADPDRLRQVLANLLSNAVQYSPNGGEIGVRAFLDDSKVWVEVEDHGMGIAAEEQNRVFEKFYRAHQAQVSAIRGTGLGLAIVRHLVEAHGGTIGLRSTPGRGSTFFLSLPVAQADGFSSAAQSKPEHASSV